MRIFGITKSGLITISLAVAALWVCIAASGVVRNRAASQQRALLRQQRQLQRTVEPARTPAIGFTRPASALAS